MTLEATFIDAQGLDLGFECRRGNAKSGGRAEGARDSGLAVPQCGFYGVSLVRDEIAEPVER